MRPVVSVIIVYYHVEKELFACLNSIIQTQKSLQIEIIVVDNDEVKTVEKELRKRFPKVNYIPSPGNIGFGAGNNLGAQKAKGEYLFFLNPDTKVFPDTISSLISFIQNNKNTGIVAPLMVDEKNKTFPLQGSGELTPLTALFAYSFINKLFPNNPISRKYWLLDWDKKSIKKTDTVPGSSFLISKKTFERIGGFDEKIFLYFEEQDIGKKLAKLNLSLFMLPSARVYHAVGKSMEKSSVSTKKIFEESRYYYFKKYFGIIPAFFTEFFLRLRKSDLLFLAIFLLAIFLRFFHAGDNFYYDGEIGDNLLDIKNYFVGGTLPLIGPPTSHPWLYFGPLFYWLYGPILVLSHFNPLSYAYTGAVFSCLIVLVNYLVIKKMFSNSTALISTYLIAISPLFLDFSHAARFFSYVPVFVYPFLYILYRISEKKSSAFFLLGLLLGVMLNFHYTPFMLIPFAISILAIKHIKPTVKEVGNFILGVCIPLSPFLLYDGMHQFMMTKNLLLWIPYRILGFLGIYHKNTLTAAVLQENTLSFGNFFLAPFTRVLPSNLGYGLVGILAIVSFLYFKKDSRQSSRYSLLFILLWGLWGLVSIFIHGNPPIHYFIPILSFPILLASIFFGTIWKFKKGKIFILGTLITLTTINFLYFFSPKWFYMYKNNPFSFTQQEKLAKTIIMDAKGKPFRLKRVGIHDEFSKNYEQNYIYLLWLYGNEPVQNAYRTYTIYEFPAQPPSHLSANEQIFSISPSLAIIREDF